MADTRERLLDVSERLFADKGLETTSLRMITREAGVNLLYHTYVTDVMSEGDRVTGVVVVNKGGLGIVKPKTVTTVNLVAYRLARNILSKLAV